MRGGSGRAAALLRALALALGVGAALPPARAADTATGGLLPVPAVNIARGQRVTGTMLTEKHFYYDPDRPLSVLTDPSEAIGKAARRTLPAGKPIPLNAFRPIEVVARGKPAEARFRMGNLTITATVLPQADAGVGDHVQARNLDTGRVISGIVAMDGSIEVSAP